MITIYFRRQEQCCGISSYKDWFNTPWARDVRNRASINAVPESCCKSMSGCRHGVDGIQINTDDIYTDVCTFLSLNFMCPLAFFLQ